MRKIKRRAKMQRRIKNHSVYSGSVMSQHESYHWKFIRFGKTQGRKIK